MKLTTNECQQLFEALYYLKVKELEGLCEYLQIPFDGPKAELIDRIKHFVSTGEKLPVQPLPEVSVAKKGKLYPLSADTLILYGAYSNDLKTRDFFKKLIGSHFHFTAFGIDWINARWKEGNPPTYQEFADMWQKETERRKITPEDPKKEWAYINFVQQYLVASPAASKIEITAAWNALRAEKVALVKQFLKIS